MFEKLAKALRGMGVLVSSYIPAPMRDAFLEMARETDRLRDEVDKMRSEINQMKGQ